MRQKNNTQGVKETLAKAIEVINDIDWSDKEVPDTVKDIYYKYADIPLPTETVLRHKAFLCRDLI